MPRLFFAVPVMIVGAFVAGAVTALVLQEPLRRTAKALTKSAFRGAGAVGDGYRTWRAEMDDARAEVAAESPVSGRTRGSAAPANGHSH
ncbi:hypothetical protein [Telmatospirillum siberiense]|nr:hypothetical protein [Telmatospirillum siberiense]